LKQKKQDVDNVEHLQMKLGANEAHVRQTLDHVNSEWTTLKNKV